VTHDHAPADWAASGIGFIFTVWQWATDGMSPLSTLVAVLSLALILLRIRESRQRRRLMQEFGEVNKSTLRRMVDAISTKPGDLKD
jgi:Flp pilus assembly protein TadB